jgi:hypothetical protein
MASVDEHVSLIWEVFLLLQQIADVTAEDGYMDVHRHIVAAKAHLECIHEADFVI